jgi:hypothetical protein
MADDLTTNAAGGDLALPGPLSFPQHQQCRQQRLRPAKASSCATKQRSMR